MGRARNAGGKFVKKNTTTPKKPEEKIDFGEKMKLRFSPTAWAKLLYLRDIGKTEVGGFGLTTKEKPLYVYDFKLIEQEATSASVDFKDEDVANFAMDMAEAGLVPAQFMRIWIHTHPNMSASPSMTDEKTFNRAFGGCDWAVMAIVSRSGDQYCRIQLNDSPVGRTYIEIPIEVDFTSYGFYASDHKAWAEEYKAKVKESKVVWTGYHGGPYYGGWYGEDWDDDPYCWWNNHHGSTTPVSTAECKRVGDDDDNEDTIPSDLMPFIDANEFILYEEMSDYEKWQLLADLKERKAKSDLREAIEND